AASPSPGAGRRRGCPAATSARTVGRPRAPVAPAMKTFIVCPPNARSHFRSRRNRPAGSLLGPIHSPGGDTRRPRPVSHRRTHAAFRKTRARRVVMRASLLAIVPVAGTLFVAAKAPAQQCLEPVGGVTCQEVAVPPNTWQTAHVLT